MDADEIRKLMRLAERATTGTPENDRDLAKSVAACVMPYGDDEDVAWRVFVAACDPQTILALCQAALRERALNRAIETEIAAITEMRKADGSSDWKEGYASALRGVRTTSERVLAELEKGEGT